MKLAMALTARVSRAPDDPSHEPVTPTLPWGESRRSADTLTAVSPMVPRTKPP